MHCQQNIKCCAFVGLDSKRNLSNLLTSFCYDSFSSHLLNFKLMGCADFTFVIIYNVVRKFNSMSVSLYGGSR